jgi:hypothetical protein
MARDNFVLQTLLDKGEVLWRPKGNSMSPRIHSGDQVRLIKCSPSMLRVNDIVYAKVKGNHYLHLLSAVDGSHSPVRCQISNNHGHINGWTDAKNVFGLCVEVGGKMLLTEQQIVERTRA